MSTDGHPSVIVLNGGSSSGKSSIARELQRNLPGIWLTFGVDTFIDALPDRGDSPRAGITYKDDGEILLSAQFRSLEQSWYAGIRTMASTGAHLILDEVFLSGKAGQEHLQTLLGDLEVFWVAVQCTPDVAASRELGRPDRSEGMARRQALSVHAGVVYDLEVDTTNRSTQECVREIVANCP